MPSDDPSAVWMLLHDDGGPGIAGRRVVFVCSGGLRGEIPICMKLICGWEGGGEGKWLNTQVKLISEPSRGICSTAIKEILGCFSLCIRSERFKSLFGWRALK